ncbi:single-stranded DNA-binding protein [Vagococcus salmoninarum]|uniref:single-stranded DNA-binding protein n=1 Tax=Vagococcus salmoninarum TaxID=2739 RepID=UPI003F9C00C6
MINNVVLVGRLTKNPDLRYTSSGSAVATFTLAVNRSFTNQSGDREADFINCVIWRKPAETLANYTRKGSLIGVVGRIQTRNYENQQGQRVYVTEVVCDNFQMLESKNANEQRKQEPSFGDDNQPSQGAYQPSQQSNQSFNQSSSTPKNDMPSFGRDADPFGSASQIDISDDDLPF